MFHMVGWRASIADITEVDLTPVVDEILTIQNAHVQPQNDMDILFAGYFAAGATRARFESASLRQMTTPFIRPTAAALLPPNIAQIADYRNNPLRIRAVEELIVRAFQTSGAPAVAVVLAGIAPPGSRVAPQGPVYTMRGTGATTVTAGAWSTCAITWQDNLPNGQYAAVGMNAIGATALAARLVFEDQVWRPGCIGGATPPVSPPEMFNKGGLGTWGRFNNNRMPNVQFLCNAADTAQEVYLDFVRVG